MLRRAQNQAEGGTAARRRSRVIRGLAVALGAPLIMGGCSWQQLSMSPHVTATPALSPVAATRSAAPRVTRPVVVRQGPSLVRGDLASGSVTHQLTAGAARLVIDYWTTQNVGSWTTAASVPIQLSAHLENLRTGYAARITRFRAAFTTDGGVDTTVVRDDSGNFVITPPFSYGSAFMLPAQPASARGASVELEYDLLVETAPGSHQYYRQTVLDHLHLRLRPAGDLSMTDVAHPPYDRAAGDHRAARPRATDPDRRPAAHPRRDRRAGPRRRGTGRRVGPGR